MLNLLVMMQVWLSGLRERQQGQSMTEYALILGLIAVVVVVILSTLGTTVRDVFTQINTQLRAVLPPG